MIEITISGKNRDFLRKELNEIARKAEKQIRDAISKSLNVDCSVDITLHEFGSLPSVPARPFLKHKNHVVDWEKDVDWQKVTREYLAGIKKNYKRKSRREK